MFQPFKTTGVQSKLQHLRGKDSGLCKAQQFRALCETYTFVHSEKYQHLVVLVKLIIFVVSSDSLMICCSDPNFLADQHDPSKVVLFLALPLPLSSIKGFGKV